EKSLDRLGIVGDAEGRIAAAAPVVKVEREMLQVGIELGAKLEQGLESDFNRNVIPPKAEQSRKKVDGYHRAGGKERGLRGGEIKGRPADLAARADGDDMVD